jgi:hypothetical protein
MDKIVVDEGIIGQGRGHRFIIVPAGVCVLWWGLLWYWSGFLFGKGGGHEREVR